jgi:TolA-binding protein
MRRSVLALAFSLTLMSGVAYAQQSSPPSGNPLFQDSAAASSAHTSNSGESGQKTGLERLNEHLDESRERAGSAAAALRDRQQRDEETLRELDRIDPQK